MELYENDHTILQRNYRNITNLWSFSNKYFVKFHVKNIGSNMIVLYLNIWYNQMSYKRIALYIYMQAPTVHKNV